MIKVRIIKNETLLLLPVRVTPKSSINQIMPYKETDEWVQIKVSAPPEDGKANKAVINVLSKILKQPKRDIKLVSGESSRLKTVEIQVKKTIDESIEALSFIMKTEKATAFSLSY